MLSNKNPVDDNLQPLVLPALNTVISMNARLYGIHVQLSQWIVNRCLSEGRENFASIHLAVILRLGLELTRCSEGFVLAAIVLRVIHSHRRRFDAIFRDL
jgi:hypothetical protein